VFDGKISDIGSFDSSEAKEIVNAEDMIVCPGFIDPHTHYDAQLFWDPYASPSNLHGVTSVVMGNCGFSIAPISDASDAQYLGEMLVQVEGMSAEALRLGVDWEWNSFEDYLGRLDGNVGVNVAAMVGHCALRRTVMKDDAVKREATEDEIAKMQKLR
jgi:N-acyl-D-aspartate/D-glutamate deacylase